MLNESRAILRLDKNKDFVSIHNYTENIWITCIFNQLRVLCIHRYIYVDADIPFQFSTYSNDSNLRSQKHKYQLNLSNKCLSFLIILFSKTLIKTNNVNKNSQCEQHKYQKRNYPCPEGIRFLWFVVDRICRDGSLCCIFCFQTQW